MVKIDVSMFVRSTPEYNNTLVQYKKPFIFQVGEAVSGLTTMTVNPPFGVSPFGFDCRFLPFSFIA